MAKRKTTAAAVSDAEGDAAKLLKILIRVTGQGKAQAARTLAKLDAGTQTKILNLAKQSDCGTKICELLPAAPEPQPKPKTTRRKQ